MTEEAPPDVKRRRLSAANTKHQNVRRITDLPSGILAHAASFLTDPSKALFAIALDKNSVAVPNERSSAIVGNQWDVLDFGGIEKGLAEKLSDSDIEKVLQCIDAVNNVKRLKLANCTKITGVGLEPLRGSLVIEQIDLSLVGEHQSPVLDDLSPPISCDHVLPIFDSIIASEGCLLKYIQFPSVWRNEPSAESDFHAFLGRYNQMRGDRGETSCLECNQSLPERRWIETFTFSADYGTHWNTCYCCLKHYCYGCDIDGEEKNILSACNTCRRDYCKDCVGMTFCSNSENGCIKTFCNDCYKYECVKCDREFCSRCIKKCKYCNKCCYCAACYDDAAGDILTCSQCYIKCCDDCRLQRCRQGQQDCGGCIKRIAPLLVGENLERKQLQEENEQLKVEMEALKREIRELKLENEELRSRSVE